MRAVPQAILDCEARGVRQLLWYKGEAWEHDGRGNWLWRRDMSDVYGEDVEPGKPKPPDPPDDVVPPERPIDPPPEVDVTQWQAVTDKAVIEMRLWDGIEPLGAIAASATSRSHQDHWEMLHGPARAGDYITRNVGDPVAANWWMTPATVVAQRYQLTS